MRPFAIAWVMAGVLASSAGATAPLARARVYREAVPHMFVDFTLGGWAFSANGRDAYLVGQGIVEMQPVVSHYTLDVQSGALAFAEIATDAFGAPARIETLGAMAFGPNEDELYYTQSGGTWVFARDPIGGGLTVIQPPETPTINTTHATVSVTPDGRYVLVTSGDGIAVHARMESGLLAPPKHFTIVPPYIDPPAARLPSIGFVVGADGRHVYARYTDDVPPNRARSGLVVLALDDTGDLTVVQRIGDGFDDWLDLSFAPDVPALSPDGRFLYVADSLGAGIVVLSIDPSDGRIRHAHVVARGSAHGEPILSPDAGLLYVTGDGLEIWARDSATGAIEQVQHVAVDDNEYVERIASGGDGRFVFTLDATHHTLTQYRRPCGDGIVDRTDAAEECDDGNFTSGDGCDAACRIEPCFACTGEPSTCIPTPGACDDGNSCTTNDTCVDGRCTGTPAADGSPCDDGNACTTVDACRMGACIGGDRMVCSACAVCDRESAECVGMLDRGCLPPTLLYVAGKFPTFVYPPVGRFTPKRPRRALRMHWSRDDPSSADDIGDPFQGSGFHVCLFDLSGFDDVFAFARQRRHVVVEAQVPPTNACGATRCWRTTAKGALAYRAKRGQPDGVRTLTLGRTNAGGLDLRATAGGRAFDVGHPKTVGIITVRVVSDTGACWQGELNSPRR